MLALCIYIILFFGHALLSQEKQNNPENPQPDSSKPKIESKKIKNSKDEDLDYSIPSSSSHPTPPFPVYSIAIANLENKFANKSSERFGFRVRITLPTANNPFYTSSYPETIPTRWLYTQEGQAKVNIISGEINEIIKGLSKCADISADTKDLLALNDFYCSTSEFLNKELQKTKYNIQQVLYDQNTGEFKRANINEIDKIQHEVDKFKALVKQWMGNATEVYNSKSYPDLKCSPTSHSYSTEWDNKINNNKFNQDLNNFIELCEGIPKLAEFKKNLIKANNILKSFDGFKLDHPQYHRHLILNKIHIDGVKKYTSELKKQEDKNLEQLLLDQDPYIPFSRQEARLKSLQEGQKVRYRTEKSYELTNDGKALYRWLGLDSRLFDKYSGIPIHHTLGGEYAFLVNTAGHMYKHGTKEQQEVAKEIAIYSDIGIRFMEKDLILQAMYTANFCWALVDCGKAMGEGVIQGIGEVYDSVTHPIETAYHVAETAKTAGHYFGKLMWIMFAEEDLIEEDPEKMERLTEHRIGKINTAIEALKEKYNSTSRHDLIKNTAALATRTVLTNKIISAGIKTMNAANKKVSEFAKKLGKAEEAGIPLTAENVPWQVNFADEAANNVLKTGKNLNSVSDIVNPSTTAILKDGYYEVNGFKFTKYYYERLWEKGRPAPSFVAADVLSNAKSVTPDKMSGFFRYETDGWEMVYNPNTKEVHHLQQIKTKK